MREKSEIKASAFATISGHFYFSQFSILHVSLCLKMSTDISMYRSFDIKHFTTQILIFCERNFFNSIYYSIIILKKMKHQICQIISWMTDDALSEERKKSSK